MTPEEIASKLLLKKWTIVSGQIRALCPFHEEQHPSFYVTMDGLYYCFGCGAKGKLSDNRYINFDTLLNMLENTEKATIKEAMQYKRKPLTKYAFKFLMAKGITPESAERFGMHEIDDAPYRCRVVVPIREHHFIARAYLPCILPKYLISKWSNRNKMVFEALHQHGEDVYVVEGIFDAVALYQHGKNAVSVLGSSLSSYHKEYLTQFKKIIIMFDNDEAGRIGTTKALKMLYGFPVYYVRAKADADELSKEEIENLELIKYTGEDIYAQDL